MCQGRARVRVRSGPRGGVSGVEPGGTSRSGAGVCVRSRAEYVSGVEPGVRLGVGRVRLPEWSPGSVCQEWSRGMSQGWATEGMSQGWSLGYVSGVEPGVCPQVCFQAADLRATQHLCLTQRQVKNSWKLCGPV